MEKKQAVLCDFDGTITKVDVINDFLSKFADESWYELEMLWNEGKIGSRELLKKQFALVRGMDEKTLYNYLQSVELDEYFVDFYEKACAAGILVAVVSDGFDLFIKNVLKNYGLGEIEVFTNSLKFENGEFYPSFPNAHGDCGINAGTCKCEILNRFKKRYDTVYYIGDGVSDYCVCKNADILFAKKALSQYCIKRNINFVPYSDFNEVINYDSLGLNI